MTRTFLAAAACVLTLSACASDSKPAASASGATTDEAFLVANARAPGVVTFPGIQYKVLKSGPADGAHPKRGSMIKAHYEGRLISGEVFDSSYARGAPVDFPLRRLITGWQTIVPLMRPGDIWELYIPAVMAYGETGAANGKIPPGATLIFKIELFSFTDEDPAASAPPGQRAQQAPPQPIPPTAQSSRALLKK
ncbi:FKBP-type peptidyl-prolyl cis-trans isomerase [Roseiterribacter gracilis]|uniref:Peptidyl-prolyl cis-trans isomerase n=1 Tax=Roseiterribacter gracilis TaxID=2812848 RepID=A0A8S8XCI6_9PROT|nr:peptidyl-prolyl cis-trans isomerase [Rhodospirillales bacterium TMPK1]